MLDYKLLEALAMVVEKGGFEKAAHALHLTQSAISQRLRLLEEQHGQILLVRSSPPRATEAGRLLLKHFRQVQMLEGGLHPGIGDGDGGGGGFADRLAVAVNADSLAAWFLPAVAQFARDRQVLFEIITDDQDETHKLLRDGDVVGCISARAEAMQGCRVTHLGCMVYRLLAAPDFATRWFPESITPETAATAPAVTFNRVDESVNALLRDVLGEAPATYPTNYVPSPEKYLEAVMEGWGYGTIPDWQGREQLDSGALIDLAPGHTLPVQLHWHRWNLDSPLLNDLTNALAHGASLFMDDGKEGGRS